MYIVLYHIILLLTLYILNSLRVSFTSVLISPETSLIPTRVLISSGDITMVSRYYYISHVYWSPRRHHFFTAGQSISFTLTLHMAFEILSRYSNLVNTGHHLAYVLLFLYHRPHADTVTSIHTYKHIHSLYILALTRNHLGSLVMLSYHLASR
jgi:hypothetical protein